MQAAQDARCEPSRDVDAPYPWPAPGESWARSTVVDYESHLRKKFGAGALIYVSATITPRYQTHITLDKIMVHDGHRGQGLASAVLAELTRDADANGWVLGLSPTDEYGTPLEVLERFYGRYGFRPNPDRLRTKREREQARKGSPKFRHSGSSMLYAEKMVRPPNGETIAPNDWALQIRQRAESGTQQGVDLFAEMNANGRTASHAEVLAELRERARFVMTETELTEALSIDAEKRTAASPCAG